VKSGVVCGIWLKGKHFAFTGNTPEDVDDSRQLVAVDATSTFDH
jgi:hypothetical protein